MESVSLEAVHSFAQSSSQNILGKLRMSIILMASTQARPAEQYADFSVTTSHLVNDNYFGRSGSGVIVVCNCRPCASLVL